MATATATVMASPELEPNASAHWFPVTIADAYPLLSPLVLSIDFLCTEKHLKCEAAFSLGVPFATNSLQATTAAWSALGVGRTASGAFDQLTASSSGTDLVQNTIPKDSLPGRSG